MQTLGKEFSTVAILMGGALLRTAATSSLILQPPLSNIFYLLQVLLPGMLLIYRVDDRDDYGEEEATRGLPRPAWMREYEGCLQQILGGAEKYRNILEAVEGGKGYECKMISSYSSYDDDEYDDDNYYTTIYGTRAAKDYTACSIECGYCGTCDYD